MMIEKIVDKCHKSVLLCLHTCLRLSFLLLGTAELSSHVARSLAHIKINDVEPCMHIRKSGAMGVLFRLLNRHQMHIETKPIKGALKR